MWIPLILTATTLVAFSAGFVLKVRSRHWCTRCGGTLRCPDCTPHPTSQQRRI